MSSVRKTHNYLKRLSTKEKVEWKHNNDPIYFCSCELGAKIKKFLFNLKDPKIPSGPNGNHTTIQNDSNTQRELNDHLRPITTMKRDKLVHNGGFPKFEVLYRKSQKGIHV